MNPSPLVAPGLALLFDMDGVIIDSASLHTQAWELYIKREGWNLERVGERMLGKRNDQILRDFFGDAMPHDEVLAHGAAKEALYRKLMLPRFEEKMIPGVRDFLARTNGTPCGLATNAEAANVEFVLGHAGIRERFRAVVDGQQVTHPKPAPDVYLEVARRLGIAPSNCIIFEDSPGGLTAARTAGGRVVCVESSLCNPPGVALSIRDFEDSRLAPWLLAQKPVVPQ